MNTGIVGQGVSVKELIASSPLYTVAAIGPTPDQAKAALEKGLDQIVGASKPVGQAREAIEHKIAALKDWTEVDARIKLIDLQDELEGIQRENVSNLIENMYQAALARIKLARLSGAEPISLSVSKLWSGFRQRQRANRNVMFALAFLRPGKISVFHVSLARKQLRL
jgi:hypothetical protein